MNELFFKFIDEFLLASIIEYKGIILMSIGAVIYSYMEYRLGESRHKSFIGFLKYFIKRNNDKK